MQRKEGRRKRKSEAYIGNCKGSKKTPSLDVTVEAWQSKQSTGRLRDISLL
jgi:hypothetical protein